MFKFDLKNFNHVAIILFSLSILTIFFEISIINKTFWIITLLIVLFFKLSRMKYKKTLNTLLAIISIYLQLKLDNYILSKEFFLNILVILLILKYLELENKQGHYFFNYICIFIAISSLIYGQDFISSFISTLIIVFSISHLYLLNQTEILKINFKNLIKLLSLSMITIPFIIIIYLIFPRQEIVINILPSQKNTLGIPDKIQLGTFDRVSNSSKKVFTYKDDFIIEEGLYFRVKIFDILDNKKDWISSKSKKFIKKYKNELLPLSENQKKYKGILILEPHNKKWVPSLKNSIIIDNVTTFNDLNLTFSSSSKIINKEYYTSSYFPTKMDLSNDLHKFYTLLPSTINNKLIDWALKTFANSQNSEDYISKILNEFSSGEFYYSLKPSDNGNNYSKFFLETKEGYCEYYAGTFAILTRAAGIPTRIVTGFYAGEYNDFGNFFNFNQSDAHAWVEVWFKNKGWVRIDPTSFIPSENIKDSNNYSLSEKSFDKNSKLLFSKTFRKLFNYARYLDYNWTNTFLKYDQKSRKNILNKFLDKQYFIKLINNLIIIILYLSLIIIIYNIIFNKKILYSLLLYKLKKKGIKIKYFHTHQKILKMLSPFEQERIKNIFDFYEWSTFKPTNNNILKRLVINLKIIMY
tara:strand:- start:873 stop:2783 length:1911 start_codon:yes stop_codon:yes gene_type:complete